MSLASLDNMPEELRWMKRWCLAGPDDHGRHKAPYMPSGKFAKNNDPSTWSTYDECIEAATRLGWGVGFCLKSGDGLTVIDLDVKTQESHPNHPDDWTTPEQLERFAAIVYWLDSYTEISMSGRGTHTWVRGEIGEGCKRDGIEIYSQERFIVCTGNVCHAQSIVERSDMLVNMVSQMRAQSPREDISLVEVPQVLSDDEIWQKLSSGGNSAKFLELFHSTSNTGPDSTELNREDQLGSYRALGYKTQSEADLALMSMFTFYSESNEQCRRLFRHSGLGKRRKSTKNDKYLNWTLEVIRGRQAAERKAIAHGAGLADALIAKINAGKLSPEQSVAPVVERAPTPQAYNHQTLPSTVQIPIENEGLQWPPGLVGELAFYIYQTSPRPVKEVAIVSALGLMSGICGKAYQLYKSGLNAYYVLVALSGVGKESLHSGISNIVHQMQTVAPEIAQFVDFMDYKSGAALSKACLRNSSFVNVCGEWGRRIKRLANETDERMQDIRTVMTNLYQKSAMGTIVGGVGYSKQEDTIESVNGIAYSMIGETTPDTFFEALTQSMMEDGFLSRFTIVEYTGDRPDLKEDTMYAMPTETIEKMNKLVKYADTIIKSPPAAVYIQFSAQANEILRAFNHECDEQIRGTKDEAWRQMWNRAHLKVLRLAATLAAGDDPYHPIVRADHAQWALSMIRNDISMFSRRLKAGDIGDDDFARRQKVLYICREYLRTPLAESYQVPFAMQQAAVIPRKFLQLRTQRMNAFTSFRMGANVAMENTIKNLLDTGNFQEVARAELVEKYGFHGKSYRILNED